MRTWTVWIIISDSVQSHSSSACVLFKAEYSLNPPFSNSVESLLRNQVFQNIWRAAPNQLLDFAGALAGAFAGTFSGDLDLVITVPGVSMSTT